MKWLSLLFAAMAAVMLYAAARSTAAGVRALAGPPGPDSGMTLIDGYTCRRGERREVVVRGREDNYSSAGLEPASPHPRLNPVRVDQWFRSTGYDDPRSDFTVSDWFAPPSDVVSGRIVLRYRPAAESGNDAILLGDATWLERKPARTRNPFMHGLLTWLTPSRGWRAHEDLHWAEFADIRLDDGRTLLAFVQGGGGGGIVDVSISDDTVVDFMAMAWCRAPAEKKGVTFDIYETLSSDYPGVATFDCREDRIGGAYCDPFVGDRSCGEPLPLLCYRDLGVPAPTPARSMQSRQISRHWSGGEVAGTDPVKASRFATIAEADRYCAANFGEGWRVAEWHLGGFGYGFSALSRGRKFSGRYWIDIRGAPHGTCWRRADEG